MEKVEFTQGILAMESDLHRFAYKLTSDRDSANDLVRIAYCRLWITTRNLRMPRT